MRIWEPLAQVIFGLVHRLCGTHPSPAAIHAHSSPITAARVPGSQEELREGIYQQLRNRHNLIYAGTYTHTQAHMQFKMYSLFSKDWGNFTHTIQSLRMLLLLLSHFSRVQLCETP